MRNASVRRDDSVAKRQIQEDSNHGGITNKYLEVALLADEQVVAYHGDLIDEFLLLIGSIVSIKNLCILWTVNDNKHWYPWCQRSSLLGFWCRSCLLVSASLRPPKGSEIFPSVAREEEKTSGTQGKTLEANDEIHCRNLSIKG